MTTFTLDKVHSGLEFQVKHMMVAKAKGEFKNFDVAVTGDINNLEDLNVDVTVDAASISTNNDDRDGHLRSADFFDVENFETIKIKSESIKRLSDDEYEMTAQVTIKDVTNTEKFVVEFNGTSKNPMDGSTVAGFEVTGKVNREAYGLTWNAPLETGGVLVGKDVKLNANFEFILN
ncbi:polyisoprenoid-binding protein YceI [Evansella vedderi]|uniref:Polyisoprenoid-binding protein YceI n=1 Tax=Evansella vedderi TaxID=38282 RepID=A0ABU0A3C3_9BACI|nr:YceI family protein [Evansella vedderi]MDQ0256855.1 polyisoprenoid-binding protein YceI [Evansella vedderi]